MSATVNTATSSVTEATGINNGHGNGGRTRERRGNRGGRTQGTRGEGRPPRVSAFKGTTPEMNGHVFECHEEQIDPRQYAKTLEALEGHIRKTMRYPEDMAPFFRENMAAPEIERPEKPGPDADERWTRPFGTRN